MLFQPTLLTPQGLAAPILLHDINLSRAQYGLAAAIFFVSYGLFMAPSALCFTRVGVTLWMAIIVVTWGCITAAFAAVRGPASLYCLRVLLGAAEAGTMPGCWFLLTRHVPARVVPLAYSVTLVFTVLAQIIGAPLGAAFLGPMEVRLFFVGGRAIVSFARLCTHTMCPHTPSRALPTHTHTQGVAGLHGWQWLFICEGALTVAVGAIVVPLLSADTVGTARWLTPDEKRTAADALTQAATAEGAPPPCVGPVPDAKGVVPPPPPPETVATSIRAASRIVTVWQIWVLGFAVMLAQVAFFGVLFFAPLEIGSAFGTGGAPVYTTPAEEAHKAMIAAFKSMIVFGPTAAAMVAAGAWVRVTGDRTGICTLSLAASAVSFAMVPAAAASGSGAALAALTVASATQAAALSPLVTWPHRYVSVAAAHGAAGYAFFNSFVAVGGILGPYAFGALSRTAAFSFLAACQPGAAVLLAAFGLWEARDRRRKGCDAGDAAAAL